MTVLTSVACGLVAGAVLVPITLWFLGWAFQTLARVGLFGEGFIQEVVQECGDWLSEAASWWGETLSPFLFGGGFLFVILSSLTRLLMGTADWMDLALAVGMVGRLLAALRDARRERRREEFATELGAFAPPASNTEEASARNLFVERTLAELLEAEAEKAAKGTSGERKKAAKDTSGEGKNADDKAAWAERTQKLDAIASRYITGAKEETFRMQLSDKDEETQLATLALRKKWQQVEARRLMGRARQHKGQPVEFESIDGPSQATAAQVESALQMEWAERVSEEQEFGPPWTVMKSPLYGWLARRIGEVEAAAVLLDVAEVFPNRNELAAALNELFPDKHVSRATLDKWLAQPTGRIWAKLGRCKEQLRAIIAVLDGRLARAA